MKSAGKTKKKTRVEQERKGPKGVTIGEDKRGKEC